LKEAEAALASSEELIAADFAALRQEEAVMKEGASIC
jgi:hypothetical protein